MKTKLPLWGNKTKNISKINYDFKLYLPGLFKVDIKIKNYFKNILDFQTFCLKIFRVIAIKLCDGALANIFQE